MMRFFAAKVGLPTIVVAAIVLVLSLISLPGYFRSFQSTGTGHSYLELRNLGVADGPAIEKARQDGLQTGIQAVVGFHVPVTLLFLIVVGLISKSTTVAFKRTLGFLYLLVAIAGVFFLSIGLTHWGPSLPFPSSLGPSLVIYGVLSAILWTVVGIGVLVRDKDESKLIAYLRRKRRAPRWIIWFFNTAIIGLLMAFFIPPYMSSLNEEASIAWDKQYGHQAEVTSASDAHASGQADRMNGQPAEAMAASDTHASGGAASFEEEVSDADSLLARAISGDAQAQCKLGAKYLKGDGVVQDDKEAVAWYLKAAAQGDVEGEFVLRTIIPAAYEAVTQKDKKTVNFMRWSAEQGNADAQDLYGLMFYKGSGVAQDYKEAAKWMRKAAEQGHAKAQSLLSLMCYKGEGVVQDELEAYVWAIVAASNGDWYLLSLYDGNDEMKQLRSKAQARAKELVAEIERRNMSVAIDIKTRDGREFKDAEVLRREPDRITIVYPKGGATIDLRQLTDDLQEYFQYDQKDADRFREQKRQDRAIARQQRRPVAEDTVTQVSIGSKYYQNKEYKEAAKWFRKAAEQGHANAQYFLHLAMSYGGRDVPQDHKEADKWLYKAAEGGYDMAQYVLGYKYPEGSVERAKWFRKAAEQGYANAQFLLGNMYFKGSGVAQDYKEAAKWMRKAAEQGDVTAEFGFGAMCYKGRGVLQNDIEAAKWFRKAAEQGHADAQKFLVEIEQ